MIDGGDSVTGNIAAEFVLDTPDLVCSERCQSIGFSFVIGFAKNLARACHGLKLAAPAIVALVNDDNALKLAILHSMLLAWLFAETIPVLKNDRIQVRVVVLIDLIAN